MFGISAHAQFGIEVECFLPDEHATFSIGERHEGDQLGSEWQGTQHRLAAALLWRAEADKSLGEVEGYTAVEFTSPILRGWAGLSDVRRFVTLLARKGAIVTSTCGAHVHIESPLQPHDKGFTSFIHTLTAMVLRIEKAVWSYSGGPERASNSYCSSARHLLPRIKEWGRATPSRMNARSSVNYQNLHADGTGTIEFRLFAGTVDSDEWLTNILLAATMVRLAARQNSPNIVPYCDSERDGDAFGRVVEALWGERVPAFTRRVQPVLSAPSVGSNLIR